MSFDLYEKVTARLNDTSIDQYADMPDVPKDVRNFLGGLGILKNIPIYYLIPDEKYLPQTIENEGGVLKLFWLDKDWIECMIDGALSLGGEEERELLLAKAMAGNYVAEVYYEETKEQIKRQIKGSYNPDDYKKQLANRLKRKNISFLADGQPEPTIAQNNWCYTGFLMRSTLISAWIGVEVIAKGNDPNIDNAPLRPLQVIRLERLSSDTLFVMCEGIIRQVDIVQPPETFHFGVSEKEDGPYEVNDKTVEFRKTSGVININKLQGDMKSVNSANFAKAMAAKPLKVFMNINWNKIS